MIHPHGETDAGDIYSLAFSYTPAPPSSSSSNKSKGEKDRAILFFGCQNTSLQWIDLSSGTLSPPLASPSSSALLSSDERRPKDARLQAVLLATTGEGESSSDYDYGAELEYEYEFDFDSAEDEGDHDGEEDEDTIFIGVSDDHPTDDSLPSSSHQPSVQKRPSRQKQARPAPPPKKPHKFFDSQHRGSQSRLPTLSSTTAPLSRADSSSSIDSTSKKQAKRRRRRPRVLRVRSENVLESAHYGYIYCMALVPSSPSPSGGARRPFGDYAASSSFAPTTSDSSGWDEIRFVSGSGDEDVKLWSFNPSSPSPSSHPSPILQRTFNLPPLPTICPETLSCGGAVLSVLVRNNCVYAGCQDGMVVVWGLEDGSLVRCLAGKEVCRISSRNF